MPDSVDERRLKDHIYALIISLSKSEEHKVVPETYLLIAQIKEAFTDHYAAWIVAPLFTSILLL